MLRKELEIVFLNHSPKSEEALKVCSTLARLLSDLAWSKRNSLRTGSGDIFKPAKYAHEAEKLLRENLALHLGGPARDGWTATSEVPSRLGGALVAVAATDSTLDSAAREAKLQEAEQLLLQSQKVNKQLQQEPNAKKVDSKYQTDGLVRLVHLYQLWNKPEKAESFQQELNNFGTPQSKPNASGLAERSR